MRKSRIGALFGRFSEKARQIPLQDRLRGGGKGIRTLGTGLDGARVDVSASCTESNTSENLEDCALAMKVMLSGAVG